MKLRLLQFSFLSPSLSNFILADTPSCVTTHQDGIVTYRAQQVILFQNNTEAAIPLLIFSKNYGVLLDYYSLAGGKAETNIDMEFPGDSKIQLLKELNPAAGTVTREGSFASTPKKSKQSILNKRNFFY